MATRERACQEQAKCLICANSFDHGNYSASEVLPPSPSYMARKVTGLSPGGSGEGV